MLADAVQEIEAVVREEVMQIVQEVSAEIEFVDDASNLLELGLRSLDLARLVASLEMRTGLDPFAAHVSITSVRTLGDLSRAYRLMSEGASVGVGGTDTEVDAATARGAARRAATKARP